MSGRSTRIKTCARRSRIDRPPRGKVSACTRLHTQLSRIADLEKPNPEYPLTTLRCSLLPIPTFLLLVPAAVLARDDFRTRRVDASWLAVLGTVSVGVSWHTLGWRTMLLQTAGNAALLLLSGTALFGYLRLRRLSVRHAFGAGDVLFLLAVAPLFAPTEFLRFLIAACVVALLWWVCCGRRRRTIPFVGAAGIVLIGWAALQFLRLWL